MDTPVRIPGMEGQTIAVRPGGTFSAPKLLINGQIAAKQNGVYNLKSNNGSTLVVKFKVRLLDPIPNLNVGGQIIQIAPALEWYQYAWMGIPVVLLFLGGAIGGFCGALAAGVSGRVFRSDLNETMKYSLTGLISLAAFITYFAVAGMIMMAVHK